METIVIPDSGAAPLGATPQVPLGQLPPDVVAALNEKANKHGLRYTELEGDFNKFINLPELVSQPFETKKRHAMLMINAKCTSYSNFPLLDYEMVVFGIQFNEGWKSSKIICGTAIPGKDVSDLFSGGKLGIPTIVSNFEEKFLEAEKMQPFSFYRANLGSSQVGAARREIASTNHTIFTPINHPEITKEYIQKWLDTNYPVLSLASLKMNISKTVTGKKAGSKPYADLLDFKRVTVSITRPSVGTKKDGSKFYQYNVQDDSLTDEERLNTKAGDKTIYGGVGMTIPKPIYTALNLDEASIIDALVTVRKTAPNDDGFVSSKTGIALDAIAVFPVVAIHKKVPTAQPTGVGKPGGQTQSFDLASQ